MGVPQKSIDTLKKQLKAGNELSSDDIIGLISPEGLSKKEMIIPTDLRGISDNFEEEFEDDFEVMMEKLGPKGTAEGILKAHEFWEKNKGNESAEKRAQPLTAKEWNAMVNDSDEDEDDDDDEDDDEDAGGEGEEEEDGEGDEEDEEQEPAAKKAK